MLLIFIYKPKTVGKGTLTEHQCLLFKSCNCSILWKFVVNDDDQLYLLYCNGRHTGDSPSNYKGRFQGPFQKAAVVRAVQNDLNATAATVLLNMANVADAQVQIDHSLKGSVDRLVRLRS